MVSRLKRRPLNQARKLQGTILTGTIFAPVLKPLIEKLNDRFGTRLSVEGVENNYFGGDVSVAGLLTGGDLLSAREGIRGEFVIIPRSTLKSDEDVMLDGMKLEELARLGFPVYPLDFNQVQRNFLLRIIEFRHPWTAPDYSRHRHPGLHEKFSTLGCGPKHIRALLGLIRIQRPIADWSFHDWARFPYPFADND